MAAPARAGGPKSNDEFMGRYRFTKESVIQGLQAGLPMDELRGPARLARLRGPRARPCWNGPPPTPPPCSWTRCVLKVSDPMRFRELQEIPQFLEMITEVIPDYGFVLNRQNKPRVKELLQHFGLVPGEDARRTLDLAPVSLRGVRQRPGSCPGRKSGRPPTANPPVPCAPRPSSRRTRTPRPPASRNWRQADRNPGNRHRRREEDRIQLLGTDPQADHAQAAADPQAQGSHQADRHRGRFRASQRIRAGAGESAPDHGIGGMETPPSSICTPIPSIPCSSPRRASPGW